MAARQSLRTPFSKQQIFADFQKNYQIFKKLLGDELKSYWPHLLDSNPEYTYLIPVKTKFAKSIFKLSFRGADDFAPPCINRIEFN